MNWKDFAILHEDGYFTLATEDTGDVPVRLFLTSQLLDEVEDDIYKQIVNATRFPGVKLVCITPDVHVGYGVPIGCVLVTNGTLCLGPVGYDVGCGMMSARSRVPWEMATPKKRLEFNKAVMARIEMGTGGKSKILSHLTTPEFENLIRGGAEYYYRRYGSNVDRSQTERNRLPVDDSWQPLYGGKGKPERGIQQLGTWASHRDEDVLRTTPNSEGVEPVRNALAYHKQWLEVTQENGMILPKLEVVMDNHCLDVSKPHYAYMYGLIQTDGHMSIETRNRGKVRIELGGQDKAVLQIFQQLVPYHSKISTRTRVTNFSQQYTSVTWSIYDKRFRDQLLSLGMPYGKKSALIAPPTCEYSRIDYFRGILDGDGSLGFTASGLPFISLVTASSVLAEAYASFLSTLTGKIKMLAPNQRDRVYNILIMKEDAQVVASTLYYDGCLALTRKQRSALEVQQWLRPDSMRKRDFSRKSWTPDEDEFILSHSIEESAENLDRTLKSVKVRLWRLRGSNN